MGGKKRLIHGPTNKELEKVLKELDGVYSELDRLHKKLEKLLSKALKAREKAEKGLKKGSSEFIRWLLHVDDLELLGEDTKYKDKMREKWFEEESEGTVHPSGTYVADNGQIVPELVLSSEEDIPRIMKLVSKLLPYLEYVDRGKGTQPSIPMELTLYRNGQHEFYNINLFEDRTARLTEWDPPYGNPGRTGEFDSLEALLKHVVRELMPDMESRQIIRSNS